MRFQAGVWGPGLHAEEEGWGGGGGSTGIFSTRTELY